MKCFILISMFFTWLSSHAFAQHDNLDTVYLKSGDVIQGIVFEIIPGESLKIRTEASHVITLDTASVLKILRRVSSEHYSSCIVHLKSGDIVEGLIHEIIPGESLKIQTQTGDVIPIERTTILKISIVDSYCE